jgi:hypothetical protein
MKTGLSITELANEISRQQDAKADWHVPTNMLEATSRGTVIIPDQGEYALTNNAHAQIAARLKIPKAYYDRMKVESPHLWKQNVNHWFSANPEMRLVRTLDNKIRAFLSDRYRSLDNYDLLETILPVLSERKDLEIESSNISEDKIYLKVFFKDLEREVTNSSEVNDIVRAGLVISNSEVGAGSLKIQPMTYRLVCTNGMISPTAMKKYHVGKGATTSMDEVQAILTDETKMLNDEAFWKTVRDIIHHNMKPEIIDAEIKKFNEAAKAPIVGNAIEAVEKTVKKYNLNEKQKDTILDHLIKGGDLTRWGLANAVTRTAEDQECYQEATNLESIGGHIVHLKPNEWKTISEVSA